MRIPATLCFAWLILAVQVGYLHAQDAPYKGKTVRVLVGFPSGGGSDARAACSPAIWGNTFPATRL